MSIARSTARSTTTKRGVGHLAGSKPSGVILNRKDLRSVLEVTLDNYDAECMYLRENELTRFDADVKMDNLRVLDLSINDIGGAVDFLDKAPHLHHLYMTGNKIETLMNISNFAPLETLCLSDNAVSSFEGLENLPNLRVLSLNFNNISSFQYFPTLPNLHTLNLVGNPITEVPSYRSMAIAINGPGLVSIDGNPVQEEERAAVEHFQGKVAHCIRQGFIVEGETVEEAADAFLLKAQREQEKAKPLQLCTIHLSAPAGEGEDAKTTSVLMEGVPVNLTLCMQDIRSYTERTTDIFHSRFLYPVIFQVSGEATEVFVVGSMNGWTDPIELERCEKDGEIYFHTTLYLPAGDYEYRYIVDGVEKVSDFNRIESQCGQGFCNLYQVTEQEAQKDAKDTILHIRWMRSNANGGFEVIEGQNTLTYTPSVDDVNCSLRAEVLAYVRGEFSFLYFDVSAPIVPAPPSCTDLVLTGKAMEGGVLRAEAQYFGGVEGASTLQWYRVAESGEESIIDLQDPWAGYIIGREDVGHRIRVEFTPRRDDWVTGEPRSEVTDIVTAGQPNCESIKIIGNLVEGSQLEVEVAYSGGEEGDSFYQWLRKVDGQREEYVAIQGQNDTKYTVTAEDVGKCLAVEYTPVNSEGKEGETCRCVLESTIEATLPQVTNLAIAGELREGRTVTLQYEYSGGRFGAHMIQWYRRNPKKKTLAKVGHTNSNFLTLTSKDVGSSIEVSMTPVRADGARGEAVQAKSNGVVAATQPEVKLLNIVGTPSLGNELTLRVEYVGGEEGASIIEWESENPITLNFQPVAHGTRHFTITRYETGKMLRVTYTPVRADGAKGEPKSRIVQIAPVAVEDRADQSRHVDPIAPVAPVAAAQPVAAAVEAAPEVKELEIVGTPSVDNELTVTVEYAGGEEGESIIEWETEDRNTLTFEPVAHGTRHFTITPDEAGKMLRVTYTPVRADGAKGEPKSRIVHIAPITVAKPAESARESDMDSDRAPARKEETPKEPTEEETKSADTAVASNPAQEGGFKIAEKTHDSDEDSEL